VEWRRRDDRPRAVAVLGVLVVLVTAFLLGIWLWAVAGVLGALAIVLAAAVTGIVSRARER
jgi:hypothetical protein